MKHRKPDKTGRSTGEYSAKVKDNLKPPGPFAWQTAELLSSPAWRGMSPNTRRLIDRLMIEHIQHGGIENGKLPVTHADFEAHGLSRNFIRAAIDEAEAFGLIRFRRGGRWGGVKRPSLYQLTWIGTSDAPPTNEWEATSEKTVEAWKRAKRRSKSKRKRNDEKQFSTPQTANDLPPKWRVLDGDLGGSAK